MPAPPLPKFHRVEVRKVARAKGTQPVLLTEAQAEPIYAEARRILETWEADGTTKIEFRQRDQPPGGMIVFDFTDVEAIDVTFASRLVTLCVSVRGQVYGSYGYFAALNPSATVRANLSAACNLLPRNRLILPVIGVRGNVNEAHLGDLGRIEVALPVLDYLHQRRWVDKTELQSQSKELVAGVDDASDRHKLLNRYLLTELFTKHALVVEYKPLGGRGGAESYLAISALTENDLVE